MQISKARILSMVIIVLIVIVITYQFTDVVPNPPVTSEFTEAPAEVREILKASCYDCHSNETKLAFYNKFPIIAEMIKEDVLKGRSKLNFSEWDKYSKKEKRTILYNIFTKVKNSTMPPRGYSFIHPEAKISNSEFIAIEDYIKELDKDSGIVNSKKNQMGLEKDYTRSSNNQNKKKTIQDAPNGIGFPDDYRTWQVVSNSFRKDHNSLRIILGNDIAIKAINENNTNPWPDGAVLGKIVWDKRSDENWEAAIVPSSFIHAEFMFKDSNKYKNTKGWGWARWVDQELSPYGKNANFSQSCIECHLPVKDRDYVFTTPSIFP